MQLSIESVEKVARWIMSDHTGLSSLFLAAVALIGRPAEHAHWPYDPSDFRRCVIFLDLLKKHEARVVLCNAAESAPQWARLVAAWPELMKIYEREKKNARAPELFAAMQKLDL